jgi:hypothetical protein
MEQLPSHSEPEKAKDEPIKKTDDVPAQQTPTPQAPPRVRHEWFQTDQFVFVDVFFKNIPKDKCTVDFESESVRNSYCLAND